MKRHEGWDTARDIAYYFMESAEKGVGVTEAWHELTHVDSYMGAYGDYHLYVDADGKYWEDFFSIGD